MLSVLNKSRINSHNELTEFDKLNSSFVLLIKIDMEPQNDYFRVQKISPNYIF